MNGGDDDDDDDDDDDNRGGDIDHNTVRGVVVSSPEFTMHTAEEAICLCLVIKKMYSLGLIPCQINTISGDTVQMQLECKAMRKASFEQMRSPVSASFTTSIAVAMGYETLSTRTIPVESVFLGMGDLQDKIQPMPVKVYIKGLRENAKNLILQILKNR